MPILIGFAIYDKKGKLLYLAYSVKSRDTVPECGGVGSQVILIGVDKFLQGDSMNALAGGANEVESLASRFSQVSAIKMTPC